MSTDESDSARRLAEETLVSNDKSDSAGRLAEGMIVSTGGIDSDGRLADEIAVLGIAALGTAVSSEGNDTAGAERLGRAVEEIESSDC